MNVNLISQKIHAHLKGAEMVLLVPHKNPDGDSLGAALAFAQYLETHKIPHLPFCMTPVSPVYDFLPRSERILADRSAIERMTFDTICVFDASDLRYAGLHELLPRLVGTPTIINIDHHISNEKFGHLNLVISDAASTTEVLYHYFTALSVPITPQIATCLLTGLITDTGHFSNPATTPASLEVAGKLIARGGNFPKVIAKVMKNKNIATLKLWGRALSRLRRNPRYHIVSTVITARDMAEFGVSEEEVAGISNFLNNLGEGKIAMVLKETEDGMIKGSLRTTASDVDLSALARLFGGGGHKRAAGFAVPGRIREVDGGWEIV